MVAARRQSGCWSARRQFAPVPALDRNDLGRVERAAPATTVLSFQTGYQRDYSRDPYGDLPLDRRVALVVSIGTAATIYPYAELKKVRPLIKDALGGTEFVIAFDSKNNTATVQGQKSDQLSHFVAFVADARAFYPQAKIFKSK